MLHVIGEGHGRFSEIAQRLQGATDRAIAQALRDLAHTTLIVREILVGPPLATRYAATPGGCILLPRLAKL